MSKTQKYDMILDALQSLLEQKDIQTISVSEIAQDCRDWKRKHLLLFSIQGCHAGSTSRTKL